MSESRAALLAAAEMRRASMGGDATAAPARQAARAAAPLEVGDRRLVPCGASLRAEYVERDGKTLAYLDGIASVTDMPYRMFDFFGEYDEIVEHGAFTKTLSSNPDVVYLLNHTGATLARTTNATLRLSLVEEGLRSEAWLNPQREPVRDLLLAIDDGVITEMSFAFRITEGWWSDDFTEFRIRELDINRGDVSAVNYGANPYTTAARTARDVLAEFGQLSTGAARAALMALADRPDMADTVRQLLPEPAAPQEREQEPAVSPQPEPAPQPEAATGPAAAARQVGFYERLVELG